jgi:hypothetical protein
MNACNEVDFRFRISDFGFKVFCLFYLGNERSDSTRLGRPGEVGSWNAEVGKIEYRAEGKVNDGKRKCCDFGFEI